MQAKFKFALASAGTFLLLTVVAGYLWQAGFLPPKSPPQKITIGSTPARISGLLYLAAAQGYFAGQGLEVSLRDNAGSPESIKELKNGSIDLACCGAFNLVHDAMAGASGLRCLTILCNAQIMDLIAREDKGITRPEDLVGKTVGLPRGTAAQYFMGRFLSLHHISPKAVTVVDVQPAAQAEALATGKVDAIVVWEPFIFEAEARLGNGLVRWPVQEGQDIYWILVGRRDYLQSNQAAMVKLLRALEQAAEYIRDHPEPAMTLICRRINFPLNKCDEYPLRYNVFLDQGMLLFMEDQVAWMVQNRLTARTEMPNFLDYLDYGPLFKANPKAVRLALPGHGLQGQ